MINTPLNNNSTLKVGSTYKNTPDGLKHLGFKAGITDSNMNYTRLDEVLTPKQIMSLEIMMSKIIKGFIEGEFK